MDTLNFKNAWIDYLDEIRPDLSIQSKKLYAHQLNKILWNNGLNDFNVEKFIYRLANKALRNKSLDFITLDGSDQTKNQRLSAVRNILEANEGKITPKKYINLSQLITKVGDEIRNAISNKAGTNIKTADEEQNMTASWDEINNFVLTYTPPLESKTGLRDNLILNLILNNYIEIDDIKSYILLRVIEYASLRIWNNRKPPPDNGQNYIWIYKSVLYIQHSKTTGGVRRVGASIVPQTKLKTYDISPDILQMIKNYIKHLKLKNNEYIFKNDKETGVIDTSYFSRILKTLLKQFGANINSTMLRKIYENRPISKTLNANETLKMNSNLDHSVGVSLNYYKKL